MLGWREMEAAQREILAKMTPTQKLRAAAQLRQSAWELKAAWLRQKHPDWSEEMIEEALRKAFANAGR